MTGQVRFSEITTVKDGTLDSQLSKVNDGATSALQSQWQVIRDGMSLGVQSRVQQAADDPLLTSVEIAGSFGLGAAMGWAMKAGGKYTRAAEIAGGAMIGIMGIDLTRRAMNISDVYSRTTADTSFGQAMRRDAVAQYAGAGLVDYSMMFAAGGLGSAYGPKLGARMSTALESLSTKMVPLEQGLQPALQPAFARPGFRMDLGEVGRLGAKERLSASSDPVTAARDRLEFPHRTVGFDQLSALMEAKQIAAHPEVRPVYEQMAGVLSKVDTMKPLLSSDEAALAGLNKQVSDIKLMKPEVQAVRTAENALNGLKADIDRVPELRQQQSSLTSQLQELRGGPDAPKRAPGEEMSPAEQDLRQQRREVIDSITNIQQRAGEMPSYEQRLAAANEALAARRASIESGKDAQLLELEGQMQPLRQSIEARKLELGSLTEQLKTLDLTYQQKSDAVRPTLADSAVDALGPVPKYTRPKIEPPARAPKVEAPKAVAEAKVAEPQAVAKSEPQAAAKPEPQAVAKPEPQAVAKLEPQVAAKPEQVAVKPEQVAVKPEQVAARGNAEKAAQRAPEPQRAIERQANSDSAPKRFERPAVTEKDVSNALREANRAVDDFSATLKRHTTALKRVQDYIDASFQWFASDKSAATNGAIARQTMQNVDLMLGKLENWEKPPAWIRPAERAQVMQRNGFDADAMKVYDSWFQTQNRSFHETSNMVPEERLMAVQDHLSRRVAVESVKNWLRIAPDAKAAVSPIVNEGFQLMASGKLPDGRTIPKGSDLMVFERKTVRTSNGDKEVILPFAKEGQHIQRFDDFRIREGLNKQRLMSEQGPQGLEPEQLYAFRLDHDPTRLTLSNDQVGYAILRPGGKAGKNVLFMNFKDGIKPGDLNLRADAPGQPGTNTNVIYNMLKAKQR